MSFRDTGKAKLWHLYLQCWCINVSQSSAAVVEVGRHRLHVFVCKWESKREKKWTSDCAHKHKRILRSVCKHTCHSSGISDVPANASVPFFPATHPSINPWEQPGGIWVLPEMLTSTMTWCKGPFWADDGDTHEQMAGEYYNGKMIAWYAPLNSRWGLALDTPQL